MVFALFVVACSYGDEAISEDDPAYTPAPNYITIRGVRYFNSTTTGLSLEGMGLTNEEIEPLRHMTNLQHLSLGENQISDLTPIMGLTNLTTLRLHDNSISDLTPLSELANLTMLSLGGNPISDFSPILELTNLTSLFLLNNQNLDFTQLSALSNLEFLNMARSQIDDLTPLSELTTLRTLILWDNQISDLTPLSTLTNLEVLDLTGNQISDLAPLSELTNLRSLYLSDNQITDLTSLSTLTNLESLNLAENQINDLTSLPELTNLRSLYLSDNQIADLTSLSDLTSLWTLYLAGNYISDLSQLSELTSLSHLNLAENQINDLTPLAGLTGLSSLNLAENRINDLTPLANLARLSLLTLNNNPINDWSPVEHVNTVYGRQTHIVVIIVSAGVVLLLGAIILFVLMKHRRKKRIKDIELPDEQLELSANAENQNENIPDNEQTEQEQEESSAHRHPVLRTFIKVFIVLNALIIILGLFPAIIPMPFLRHISIPTPWRFHAGYGTPLGLSLVPAIVITVACVLMLMLAMSALRRTEKSETETKEWFRLYVYAALFVVLICTLVISRQSERQGDYIRELLSRDVPDGIQVHASESGADRFLTVRISATTEVICISEFEEFVKDMQVHAFRIIDRVRTENYALTISLNAPSLDGRIKSLEWRYRSPIWHFGNRLDLADGEYGALIIDNLTTNVRDSATQSFAFGLSGSSLLPVTSIQETINTIMIADNFAKDLESEIPSDVSIVRFWDDENVPYTVGVEYGKVDVSIRHISDYFTVDMYGIEEAFIDISAKTWSIAENHNMQINRLRISFRPDGFENSVFWTSIDGSEYGIFGIGGNPGREFENIHITGIQELITYELLEEINEENQTFQAYLRLHRAFEAALQENRGLGRYREFDEMFAAQNEFGINIRLHLLLRMYEHYTAITLTHETVVEYFSEQFEPDGSLRLYNNGLHPDIYAFVVWVNTWDRAMTARSLSNVERIYYTHRAYSYRNKSEGFIEQNFEDLSPQMLDAIWEVISVGRGSIIRIDSIRSALSVLDELYDHGTTLDLTSLQQAGY